LEEVMTKRLNEGMRKAIVERLMRHAFDKETKDLADQKRKLNEDIYNDIYSAKLRALMRKLPSGYFAEGVDLYVQIGGEFVQVPVSEHKPVAHKHTRCSTAAKIYQSTDPIAERHDEWRKQRRNLRERQDKAKSAASAALGSCSTMKQLLEVWPEAAPFVKDFLDTPKTVALTIAPKELNQHFGLKAA
jgi:hypothetical protein